MKISCLRQAALLGLAAAAILGGGSASAQTAPSPFNFQLTNQTNNFIGDPTFSVTDDLTFTNLQLTENFADMTSLVVPLSNLDTGGLDEQTPFDFAGAVGHGGLSSTILSGDLAITGFLPSSTLDLTLQPTLDPTSQYTQTVQTHFSTTLGAPNVTGVAVGQFSLLFGTGNSADPVVITPITVAAVPEASTVVSMGVMLALGLGLLAVSRRRRTVSAE
jgi:MYXO-CTERM domain-containing protein